MTNGRRPRLLVCEPTGFGVHHLLNPWMRWDEAVDVRLAWRQWDGLCEALVTVGAELEVMEIAGPSSAMTFTRDVAVVVAPRIAFSLSNFGPRGDLEPEFVTKWLGSLGFDVRRLNGRLDGGNLVRTTEGWLIGIPPGAPIDGAERLARRLRSEGASRVDAVPLQGARYGHLDTALCDLGGRAWLIHSEAFVEPDLDADSWRSILTGRAVIRVEPDEAEQLACNVVIVGNQVVGSLTPRLCRAIEHHGLEPIPVDLDEFRKAGGGAHCLTLELTPHARLLTDSRPSTNPRQETNHVP